MCERDTETEIERGRDREIKRETGREKEKEVPRQKVRVRVRSSLRRPGAPRGTASSGPLRSVSGAPALRPVGGEEASLPALGLPSSSQLGGFGGTQHVVSRSPNYRTLLKSAVFLRPCVNA